MDGLKLRATAHVKLTKCVDGVEVVEEHDVELTEEEAAEIWHLQQQE